MAGTDLLARADGLRTGRTPFVLATVVRAERPTSAKPGDRALVLPDGTIEGFVGGSCAESTVRTQGLRLLETGESTLLRITQAASPETATEGLVTVANPCLSGGSLDIFLEAMLPPMLVHVYGEAPVARALVEVGRALGHDVRRPPGPDAPLPPDLGAVVVATHGHADEQRILTAALRAGVPYVGLIASRKRGAAVLAGLDVPADQRNLVHSPAGLDIGARNAQEVALSVYAEVIALRPRRAGAHPHAGPRAAEPAGRRGLTDGVEEAVDPVCGMTVAVSDAALSLSHGTGTVYFCGPGCRQAFADDPGRYANG